MDSQDNHRQSDDESQVALAGQESLLDCLKTAKDFMLTKEPEQGQQGKRRR